MIQEKAWLYRANFKPALRPLSASTPHPPPSSKGTKSRTVPTIQLPVDYIFQEGESLQHCILDGADAVGCQVGHFCPRMDVTEGVAALGRDGSALGQEEDETRHGDQV